MASHYSFKKCDIGPDLFFNYRTIVDEEKELVVRDTPGKGKGLFASYNIPKGSFITEYWGEVVDRETKDVSVGALKAQGLRASYFAQMGNCSFVDATHSECLAKYVNHSCQPNCKM